MTEQRTLDWHRARLGKITGSQVYKLMTSGRKKDEIFGETAKSYLRQIASEIMLNPDMVADDEVFQEYIDQNTVSSKAIQWGIEQESRAKWVYSMTKNVKIEECPSIQYGTWRFASSPDGKILTSDGRINRGIEVKCPGGEKYVKYLGIKDAATLKEIAPEYYWQCLSHMMVLHCSRVDFIVYNPWMRRELHVATIKKNKEDIELLKNRIREGLKFIQTLIKR